MDDMETRCLAYQLEVNLDVDSEREKLVATPASRITPELREGLTENKDQLMRDLLLRKAQRFIAMKYPHSQEDIGSSDEVNRAYLEESFSDLRQIAWEWAQEVMQRLGGATFKSQTEVFDAFRTERDRRGWKEIA